MKKHTYFDTYDGPGWPEQAWLAKYFLTPAGRRKFFELGNDSWGLNADGLDGTEHLQQFNGRIDIRLTIVGNLDYGILLCHQKFGPNGVGHYSIGDLGRLHEWVKTKDGDLMPIGLFIPFETAWKAVKEFMETDGALPKSIAWIPVRDLPPDSFPNPYESRRDL
jgi:hypothetical protein